MEAKATYVAPRAAYLEHLAQSLRRQDIDELEAVHGSGCDVAGILTRAVTISQHCVVGLSHDTGLPMVIFGVAPAAWDKNIGVIWMVGTDELFRHRRNLLVEGRLYVEEYLKTFRVLLNFVDVRNSASIRWLSRLGFTFAPPEPYGVRGLDFYLFTRRADGVRADVPPA